MFQSVRYRDWESRKKKKFKAGQATMADETRASRNDCPGHIVEFWHCSDATINKRKKKKKKRQKLSHKLQFGCRAQGWMFYVSNGEGAGQDIGGVSCNAKRGKTP